MKKQFTYGGMTFTAERIRELTMKKVHSNAHNASDYRYSAPRRIIPRFATIAVTLIITLTLATVAYATNAFGVRDFINTAFGTGIGNVEGMTVDKPGGSSYELPAAEREDVDNETAQGIIGGYVESSNTTVSANGFTFTVLDYVMDENGLAVITYTLENPDGINGILHDAGVPGVYYDDEKAAKPEDMRLTEPMFTTTSGKMLDSGTYIDRSLSSDTKATLVVYITPFNPIAAGEGIVMNITGYENREYNNSLATVNLPALDRLTAREFTGKDFSASVSPIGITVRTTLPSIDAKFHDWSIRYKDDSEYVLVSSAPYIMNTTADSLDMETNTSWSAFNRLVDIENIESVSIEGNVLLPKITR